ncbi:MAG: HD domain-containing protein [Candidatus Kerfeldbacteria bacterium]|nr:HD domain-containing protein [Candidatus Kerfeldbacteria bacterium]
MKKFDSYTDDLLRRPEIQRLARRRDHHFRQNRLEHSLATARVAFWMARFLRADARICARAALLHDWFFEDRAEHHNRFGANVRHSIIAAANAEGLGEVGAVVEAIRTHMWIYVRGKPRTREAWIVWMADNITWLTDGFKSFGKYLRRKARLFIYGQSWREVTHAS